MMTRLRWIAFGALLVGLTPTCKYPTFSYGTSGSGGAAGGSTTDSSSSSSSSSTSSSSSSSSSSSGAPCTVQHAGGGTCEFLPGLECGCPANKKCTVVDDSGRSACVFAGSTPPFARCSTDADCAAGSYCTPNKACQPFCVNNMDCLVSGGGQCLPVPQSDGMTPIPDVSVCAAHCDLVTGKPCGAGLNCIYEDDPKEFECVFSKGLLEGTACGTDSECALKLGCNDLGDGKECLRWCQPADQYGSAGCTTLEYCYGFNPPIQKNGTISYGVCGF